MALAVAAIPEGLPIVATLALARGNVADRWSENAFMEHQSAVGTLRTTTRQCLTDKTGTLTENRMNSANNCGCPAAKSRSIAAKDPVAPTRKRHGYLPLLEITQILFHRAHPFAKARTRREPAIRWNGPCCARALARGVKLTAGRRYPSTTRLPASTLSTQTAK